MQIYILCKAVYNTTCYLNVLYLHCFWNKSLHSEKPSQKKKNTLSLSLSLSLFFENKKHIKHILTTKFTQLSKPTLFPQIRGFQKTDIKKKHHMISDGPQRDEVHDSTQQLSHRHWWQHYNYYLP